MKKKVGWVEPRGEKIGNDILGSFRVLLLWRDLLCVIHGDQS